MDGKTTWLNQVKCDKCCGSGRMFGPDAYLMIAHWRGSLKVNRKTFAALANIPYTLYCKFEKGSTVFSENRMRKLTDLLKIIEQNQEGY